MGAPTQSLAGQQSTPSEVAGAFFDAIGNHRWEAATGLVHPETQDLFRYRLHSMLDADPNGRLAALVFDAPDGPSLRALSGAAVFAALLEAIEADTPGLIAVLATNRYDPLGHVMEGQDTAHAVLRVTPYTNGSAPSRTIVVTMRLTQDQWRIAEAGELDSLATAMTGLAFTARSGGI